MKIKELLELRESKYPMEWRFSTTNGNNAAVLFTDYGRGMEYSAVFVFAEEDDYRFHSQKVSYHGDHITWGESSNTKKKRLSSRAEVNAFVKSQGYPEIPNDVFEKMEAHSEDTAHIADTMTGGSHRFKFKKEDIEALREKSKSYDDFELGMFNLVKKTIRKNNWFMHPKELTEPSKRVLKKYYDSGAWPRKS